MTTRTPKRKTPKRKTPKRRTPKRKTPKRKTPKRKTPKRTPKRRTPKRRTPKRKTPKRKTPKRTPKRRTPTQHIIPDDCSKLNTWYIDKTKKLGKGQVGIVYVACKKNDCNYVVKIQEASTDKMFKREMEIVDRLTKLDSTFIPKQYDMFTCKKIGYTVMEQLYKPEDVLRSEKNIVSIISDYLDDLYKNYKIVFVDIHEGNLMTRKNGEIVLIDFGWAVSFKNENEIVRDHPSGGNVSIKTLKKYQDTNLRDLRAYYRNHRWTN